MNFNKGIAKIGCFKRLREPKRVYFVLSQADQILLIETLWQRFNFLLAERFTEAENRTTNA